MNVLVTYATANGSTRGIAEAIAARLREAGHSVEATPASADPDPAAHDAVLVGSAIHNGHWLTEADAFVERNRAALACRPLWLFSVGSIGHTSAWPLRLAAGCQPRNLEALRGVLKPRGVRAFAGVVEWDLVPAWARPVFGLLGVRFGDARDWDDVAAWADQIVNQLRSATLSQPALSAAARSGSRPHRATPAEGRRAWVGCDRRRR